MITTLQYNHDISFLPTMSSFLSIMYYITDYATKLVKLMYHYFLIAAGLKQQLSDNHQSDSNEETEFNKSR